MNEKLNIVDQESVWRDKSVRGTLTLDDVKDIVKCKREGRISAAFAQKGAAKKRATAKSKKVDDMTFDAFAGLDEM